MSLTIAILTFLAITLLGALAYWHEFKKTQRKFSPFQIVIIIVLALAVALGVWNEVNKYSDAKKDKGDIIDTSKNEGIKTRGAVTLRGNKTDKKIDSSAQRSTDSVAALHGDLKKGFKGIKPKAIPQFAILGLCPLDNSNNPIVIKTQRADSVYLRIAITNFGNIPALNVHGGIFCVFKVNGVLLGKVDPLMCEETRLKHICQVQKPRIYRMDFKQI